MSVGSTLILPTDSAADRRSWLDRLGISASLLCAVHCLAAPFLLLLLPAAGSVWAHPAVHWILAILVLPLALWVIYSGYRQHRRARTLVAAGLGAGCIVAGLILPMVSSEPVISTQLPGLGSASAVPVASVTGGGETACTDACCPTVSRDAATGGVAMNIPPGGLTTLIGSLLLVCAHLTNLIACRKYGPAHQAATNGPSDCGCAMC